MSAAEVEEEKGSDMVEVDRQEGGMGAGVDLEEVRYLPSWLHNLRCVVSLRHTLSMLSLPPVCPTSSAVTLNSPTSPDSHEFA